MWPEVEKFVRLHADAFKHVLKVKDSWGASPVLRLTHGGGTDTMRVDAWKMAQLQQFLKERLVA
eukprot:361455-Chlamydomonas_euryale.AAC.8